MKPATYITTSWDDGDPLDLRVAEMLARHNLRGTFYIPRKGPTQTMNEAQIHALSENFEIGAHTMDHVYLDEQTNERAAQEIRDSRKWVQDVTGKPCPMFCPPGGKFNAAHVEMIRESGFSAFRTVELMSLDSPRKHDGLLELPTTLQAHPQGPACYTRNLLKRRAARNFWVYLLHGRGDWLSAARSLLNYVLSRGGVFHLWGHSWEIEEHDQWQCLDQALKLISEHSGESRRVTNGELASAAAVC